MGPVLVLGPVRGVAEGFGAAREFTGIRLLACVCRCVHLQIVGAAKAFITDITDMRSLPCVFQIVPLYISGAKKLFSTV